jgi:hypothetical protein
LVDLSLAAACEAVLVPERLALLEGILKMITKRFGVAALFLGWMVFGYSSVPAGPTGLLGVQLGHPDINIISVGEQPAAYDGVNLVISGIPFYVNFTSGGTDEFVLSGNLSLSAPIDTSGTITPGGTFSVTGTVSDSATSMNYSGVLLSGTVTDYGILDIDGATTDLIDFRLQATGGTLKSLFDANGSEVGAVFSLENSTFNGTFDTDTTPQDNNTLWVAATVKGDIAPIPDVPQLPPLTIGFWKNHPEAWPVTSLNICGSDISQGDLIDVLSTPTRGDKTIIMAQQLIAAMLNAAGGNSCPTIDTAEQWLCDHGGIAASRKQWDGGEELKNTLDSFNNGDGC